MNALLELQRDCARAFVAADGDDASDRFVSNRIPARTRIKVYENNLRETYRKGLLGTYPVIERLVGNVCFASLAAVYARQHPSRSGDLQHFGRSFPGFLAAQYGETEFAYLPDVARLEQAIEDVLLEPHRRRLQPDALAGIGENELPRLRFTLAPALRLIASRYPMLAIWQANQPGRETGVDLDSGPQRLAVTRSGDEAELHTLSEGAFDLATLFAAGADLGTAFERLAGNRPEQYDVSQALGALLRAGCIESFSIDPV